MMSRCVVYAFGAMFMLLSMAEASQTGCVASQDDSCDEEEDLASLLQAGAVTPVLAARTSAPQNLQKGKSHAAAAAEDESASLSYLSPMQGSKKLAQATTEASREAAPPFELPLRLAVSLSQQSTQIAEHVLNKVSETHGSWGITIGLAVAVGVLSVLIGLWCQRKPTTDDQDAAQRLREDARSRNSAPSPRPQTADFLRPQRPSADPGCADTPGMSISSTLAARPPAGSAASTGFMGAAAKHLGGSGPASKNMPASESCFAVALHDLASAGRDCSLDVIAVSGLPLLSMTISGGNILGIGLAHQGGAPRCRIIAPDGGVGPFIIHDSQNKPYGQFYCRAQGRSEVIIDGKMAFVVESTDHFQHLVKSSSGQPIGLARINNVDFSSDHIEVRACPGADAVLILSVILALVVFTGKK